MRFTPFTCEQRDAMLARVGIASVDELFSVVPERARLHRALDLPSGLSEIDLMRHMRDLAGLNTPATSLVSFAGAGCYDHHVPAVVDQVVSRPEFFTAYTPYQPEVSQGTLQAVYEYQTMICELTGMEVSNAGMYDGATALVEAVLMAARVTGRRRVVVAGRVHPDWGATLATYSAAGVIEPEHLGDDGAGRVDPAAVASALGDDAAAVLVASPSYVGTIEDVGGLASVTHAAGALLVVAANPIMLGVMASPGSLGADIVVGEGQPLGCAMSFGGPGLGLFACRQEHVRQMPGRLAGRTLDVDGSVGYVLTFSTREQHIRREKATSNICSNHALNALAAGVYLAAVGREGLAGIAAACVSKAHYLRERLLGTGRFAAPWDAPFAHEFALRYEGDISAMHAEMLGRGFLAGVPIGDGLVLLAVTEKRTRAEMDAFAEEVSSL